MIKVYIFELILPIGDKDISLFLSELNSSEIKVLPKQGGRKFEPSLIGKVLAKRILSNETLISKENIIIGKTKLGKPIIKTPNNLNFDISISHSGSYLTIGICNDGKIGVDVELLKDINYRVFRNCLSVSEEKYVNSGKEITQRLENFYEIWTRKEAYSKTLGTGLQRPLSITQFYLGKIKPRTVIKNDNQRYYFRTLKKDKFILSVCTTSLGTFDPIFTKLTADNLWSFLTDNKTNDSNVSNRQGLLLDK